MDRDDAQEREMLALRNAKADLETLIDTSPVGVLVFGTRSGAPTTVNREMKRIVDGLCNQDRLTELLLEVLTVCRADGRETSMEELSPDPGDGCGTDLVRGQVSDVDGYRVGSDGTSTQ